MRNMWEKVNQGFHLARTHPGLVVLFFLYQWAWGFALYRFIGSAVIPLMQRYPGWELGGEVRGIFFAESELNLMKTDIMHAWLWILLLFIIGRMLFSPLWNAGVYYTLMQDGTRTRRPFLTGIRKLGRSFTLLYALRMVLTIIPLYWLLPWWKHLYLSIFNLQGLVWSLVPWLIVYFIYTGWLRLLFMYIQFGVMCEQPLSATLSVIVRQTLPIGGIAATLFLIFGCWGSMQFSTSMILAGFTAIALTHIHYLVSSFFQIWKIGAHYSLWRSQTPS